MAQHHVEPIANYHCKTGENPLWDEKQLVFYWTDIPTGRLFQYEPRTGHHEPIYDGEQVGGFTLQEDGRLLLFRVRDIALRHPNGDVETLIEYSDDDMQRFNDVIADPEGRVFAGTIGARDDSGGLYRVDGDGSVTQLFTQTKVANGMAFTADLATFYWTDSPAKKIFAFDYDRSTGELSNRRVALDTGDLPGVPDGMTLDRDGNLYSARWGGSAVYVFSPEGKPLDRIDLPVPHVTSCVFGGERLNELYITTAATKEAGEDDGTLYRVTLDAAGRPEFRSRIG
jgi:D-xylonolactonase